MLSMQTTHLPHLTEPHQAFEAHVGFSRKLWGLQSLPIIQETVKQELTFLWRHFWSTKKQNASTLDTLRITGVFSSRFLVLVLTEEFCLSEEERRFHSPNTVSISWGKVSSLLSFTQTCIQNCGEDGLTSIMSIVSKKWADCRQRCVQVIFLF